MPRSPSRDLSDRYIGKRGYFRTPDAIRRGKYALAVVALVGAGAWAAVDVLRPSKAAYAHSHGPLANPYAFGYLDPMKSPALKRFTHTFVVNESPGPATSIDVITRSVLSKRVTVTATERSRTVVPWISPALEQPMMTERG